MYIRIGYTANTEKISSKKEKKEKKESRQERKRRVLTQ